ncbi:hypothetical protein J2S74_000396 [Evansella vedderi]|uniref:Uncharacterized protein n=1 Tax=Evansella vedderi TaxID=38282 RepID=A0ABT9ZPA4_9BACI|nr:hypothetical protein [Evansella vedderi]MDQ0253024.1 hypothetical protein [Evansella vedderi]
MNSSLQAIKTVREFIISIKTKRCTAMLVSYTSPLLVSLLILGKESVDTP